MKKILSFFIILGAITFINIDLFASSYQGITLDTQLQDLDNRSLRDIFDTGNLLDTFNFVGYQATFTITQDVFEIYSVSINSTNTNPAVYSSNVLTIGNDIYVSGQMMTTNAVNYLNLLAGNNNYVWLPNINQWYTISSKQVASSTMFELQARQNVNGGLYYARNIVILDLDNLLLDTLTKSQLDYYYSLYILLKNGYTPDVFYDEGYNNGNTDGYVSGYNNGYDVGNLQGYNDGYDDGLFDYHTGNYYGPYDYTLSEPYDQATQANISLLNVFSMIIGVVMSMLGFIINIEIFNISIAGILGTLFIGVSFIWMLKLIRG